MKELYAKLYNDANLSYRYQKKQVPMSEMAHFVSMKGNKYGKDEKGIRLFVIGRATNDWDSLPCENAESFLEKAGERFKEDGFKWVVTDDRGRLCNIPKEGKKPYYLEGGAFWRVVGKIWRVLTDSNETRFVDYIAWSNLYKIAPKEGNPTTTMCKKQFSACREILEAEIKAYEPTHILIIAGYDSWYADKACDFSEIFERFNNNNRIGSNLEDRSIYVEGTASYVLNGNTIPVVITCRPEGRDEGSFIDAVVRAFKSNAKG